MVAQLKRNFMYVAMIVLAATSLRVQQARSQTKQCCVTLQTVTINYSSPGCKGTVTFKVCNGGQCGSTGNCYSEFNWSCCTSSGNTFANPSGTCTSCQGSCNAPALFAQPWSVSPAARPIFLRGCSGQYVLVRPGSGS
jgi:hypothetical protein